MPRASFRSQTTVGDATFGVNNVNSALPTGTVSGDAMILTVSCSAIAPASPPAITTPSGWTPLGGASNVFSLVGGAINAQLRSFVRVAGSSEGTVNVATTGGTNAALSVVRTTFQNAHPTTPFGSLVYPTTPNASSTSASVGGITTTQNNTLLYCYFAQDAAQTVSSFGTMTGRANNGTYGIASADEFQITAGASGTRTFTLPAAAQSAWAFVEVFSANSVAADSVTFSDSGVGTTERIATASDTVTPSDSGVSTTARVSEASDTNTPTDSGVASLSFTAEASDTNTPTDSAVSTTDRVVEASDTNTPTDSADSTTDRVAEASDTNTPSDSAVSVSERPAAATDTVAFSDSADALVAVPTDAADTVTFSDSAVSVTERAAAAEDAISLSDSATSVTERLAVAEDSLSLTDDAEAAIAGGSEAADTATFSDSAESVSERAATAEDTTAFSDSAEADAEKTAVAEDAIAFSDSAEAGRQPAAVAEDTVAFTDEGLAVLVPPSAGGGRAWLRTLLQERYTREFEEYARKRREEADAPAPRPAPISKAPSPTTSKEPAKVREATSHQTRELTQVLRTLVREAQAPQAAIFELPAPTNVDQVRAVAAPSPDFTAEDEETILHVAQMLNL